MEWGVVGLAFDRGWRSAGRMSGATTGATLTVDAAPAARRRWIALAAVAGLVGLLFYELLRRQVLFAVHHPADWGHTLVVPFIAVYLVGLRREELLRTPLRTTWLGLPLAVLGVGWYMLTCFGPDAIRHHNLQGAGLGLTLFGLVLLFFGWAAMRWLWFPLAYAMAFGITISEQFMNVVTYRLQDVAARGAWLLLNLFTDTGLNGNTLTIYDAGREIPLNVAEACSGMRMLVAFLALGVFFAVTRLNRFWQRALLVALAVPTAIFVNVLRVATLGILATVNPEFAAGDFHEFVGLVWLVPALLIYLGLIWVINRLVIEEGAEAPRATPGPNAEESPLGVFERLRFDGKAKLATVAACVTLAVTAVGFRGTVEALNLHLQKKPVPLRRALANIPTRLGEWEAVGTDQILDKATIETLGTDEYLIRVYAPDGDMKNGWLTLHVAYYTGMIDAVPHVPDRCWIAGGMTATGLAQYRTPDLSRERWSIDPERVHEATGEPYRMTMAVDPITRRAIPVRLPVGEIEMRALEFADSTAGGAKRFAGYFFLANGRTTPHPLEVRKWAFDTSSEYSYYAKVEFAMGGSSATMDDFMTLASGLLDEALPEIMRCLPDWSEVEAGTYPVVDAGEQELLTLDEG